VTGRPLRPGLGEPQRAFERGVTIADDHDAAPRQGGGIGRAVEHLRVIEGRQAVDLQAPRLKRSDARGDEDRLRQQRSPFEFRPESGRRPVAARRSPPARSESARERFDLLQGSRAINSRAVMPGPGMS